VCYCASITFLGFQVFIENRNLGNFGFNICFLRMKHSQILPLAFCLIFFTLFLLVQARHHHSHKKHKHSHSHKSYETSPPSPPPPPPRDDAYFSNTTEIFDVRSFGAIGDGIEDDTESFKTAWDSACQSESEVNVILVPQGFSFVVQSTIFSGPCQGDLVFKVIMHSYSARIF
jgi:hypothetical protein